MIKKLAQAPQIQRKTLENIVNTNKDSEYLKYNRIESAGHWQLLPLVSFDDIAQDIYQSIKNPSNRLTSQKIIAYSQSSGTTNKRKWIPQTLNNIKKNYEAGLDMLALYLNSFPTSIILNGVNFSLTGSVFKENNKIIGDISALIAYYLPSYFSFFKVPTKSDALIPEWEKKINRWTEVLPQKDIRWIAGVPSWTNLVISKCIEKKSSDILWKNIEVFFYGGTSLGFFRKKIEENLGKKINFWQNYNASEGFIATQFSKDDESMVLLPHLGIYYEFLEIESGQFSDWAQLKIGKTYELIISNNCGLYRYRIGDLVKIEHLNPLRISIAGRSNYCINAFGEELMHQNVRSAINSLELEKNIKIYQYTIAPYFEKNGGGHFWLVAGDFDSKTLEEMANFLDNKLQQLNTDYAAKRYKNLVMNRLKIESAPISSFQKWQEKYRNQSVQTKIPQMSSDMEIINQIMGFSKSMS